MIELYLPRELKSLIAGKRYVVDDVGMSSSKVLIFDDMVLKIQPDTQETRTEQTMLAWLDGKLPVPKCLFHTVEEGINYLLMSRVSGKMACDAQLLEDPKLLVSILAESLKKLWQVDITGCPVKWNLQHKLAAAREAVDAGAVNVEDAEPETFGTNGFESPSALLAWLSANQPPEDLVLSHGDFCLPNVFVEAQQLSGLIDLGRTGVADRWQDIALCWRSLKHNYGAKYGGKVYENFDPDCLFDALDIVPDREKLNYYILLDELF